MFGLGLQELIIILIILFFVFGAKRIPEMMKGVGQGIKEFKNTMRDDDTKDESKTEKKSA